MMQFIQVGGLLALTLLNLLRSADAAATCATLPAAYDPTTVCSGVVTYPFYLPDGASLAYMNGLAKTALGNAMLPFLPPACLADLKKLTCANVYRKCNDNVDLSDYHTYVFGADSSVLPYKRPCKSLCTAVSYAGTSCAGILEGLGIAPSCTATDPYTGFSTYDAANTVSTCNDLSGVTVRVAGTTEPYIHAADGTGVCSGVIQSNVYVPSGPALNSALAPLLPPYVVQSMVEAAVVAGVSQLPAWRTKECQEAATIMYCSKAFMPAEHITSMAALGLTQVYLPQYPAKSLCLNYRSACAGFIDNAKASSPAVDVDCDELTATGAVQYPEDGVRVTLATVPVPNVGNLPLQTMPNQALTADIEAEVVCPFTTLPVVHADYPGVELIGGTGCAIACPLPFDTEAARSAKYAVGWIGTIATLVTNALLAIALFKMGGDRSQRLHQMITCVCFIVSCSVRLTVMIAYPTLDDLVCNDTTSYVDATVLNPVKDLAINLPLALVIKGRVLEFDAVLTKLGFFVINWAELTACSEVYARVIYQVKDVSKLRQYVMPAIAAANIGFFLYYTLASKRIGYLQRDFVAFVPEDDAGFYVGYFLPIIFTHVASVFMILSVLYRIFMVTGNVMGGSVAKMWKMVRLPTMHIIGIVFAGGIGMGVTAYVWTRKPAYLSALSEWYGCAFSNFKHAGDVDYLDVCGIEPREWESFAESMFMTVVMWTIGTMSVGLVMNADMVKFLMTYFGCVFSANANKNYSQFASRAQSSSSSRVAPEDETDGTNADATSGEGGDAGGAVSVFMRGMMRMVFGRGGSSEDGRYQVKGTSGDVEMGTVNGQKYDGEKAKEKERAAVGGEQRLSTLQEETKERVDV